MAAGRDEIVVYQIGRRYPDYVAGTADLAPTVRVTAVSVVDVRRDVPIYAGCHVAAAGSEWDFPVMATFHCTVISPVTVVRNRRTDSIRNMSRYLDRELTGAAPHRARAPGDEHDLRRTFTELIERRSTFAPIPGVQVVLASLDVMPACLTDTGEA